MGGGLHWLTFAGYVPAGLSAPHYSLFCGHIIDPILVTLTEKEIFAIPTKSLSVKHLLFKAFKLGHPEIN